VLVVTDGSILNNKATYTTVIIINLNNENPTFAASTEANSPPLQNSLTRTLFDRSLLPSSLH
jgi:hypothetical protein